MMDLNDFMKDFYESLRIAPMSTFDSARLLGLCWEGARIVDLESGRLEFKSLDEHCAGMARVFEERRDIRRHGFEERETRREVMESGNAITVMSEAEKRYFDGRTMVLERGTNTLSIIGCGGVFKIAYIVWEPFEDE